MMPNNNKKDDHNPFQRTRHTFLITDILQSNDDAEDDANDDDIADDDDTDDEEEEDVEAEDLTLSCRQTSSMLTSTTTSTTLMPRKARKARTAFSDSQLQSLVSC